MIEELQPYITFGYNELKDYPEAKEGDTFKCRRCQGTHNLECATDEKGEKTTELMFYRCRGSTYLGAINGKRVVDVLLEK